MSVRIDFDALKVSKSRKQIMIFASSKKHTQDSILSVFRTS